MTIQRMVKRTARCSQCGLFSPEIEYNGNYAGRRNVFDPTLEKMGWVHLHIISSYHAYNFTDQRQHFEVEHWYCCEAHAQSHADKHIIPFLALFETLVEDKIDGAAQ